MSEETNILDLRSEEERIIAYYKELSIKASSAYAEKEAYRDQEIWPLIREGIALEYGDQILVPEYQTRASFDWERAVAEGQISQEILKAYSTVKVIAVLNFRKRDDKEMQIYEQYIEKHKPLNDEYKAALKEVRSKKQHEVIK